MYAFAFVGRTVGSGRRGSACRRGECGTGVVNRVTREGATGGSSGTPRSIRMGNRFASPAPSTQPKREPLGGSGSE